MSEKEIKRSINIYLTIRIIFSFRDLQPIQDLLYFFEEPSSIFHVGRIHLKNADQVNFQIFKS